MKESTDELSCVFAAPGFVTITDVTQPGAQEPEFVIANEATGKYFGANQSAVQLFIALKETGSAHAAIAKCRLPEAMGHRLIERFLKSGVIVRPGQTETPDKAQSTPIESRLISLRWDLVNATGAT
ncbi:MAG: hypothetical protein AB8B51_10085 [Sedimentitalea sp.]